MINGMLLIDKPIGYTSQDICNKIKHILHVKKVGHCGTLDPFASGLMIILINNATKLLPFIMEERKHYIANIKLGKETDTLDSDGNIIKNSAVPDLNKEKINAVLHSFLGKSLQKPPIYSAIKIKGKPAYDYARKGIDIELKEREIEVFDIELLVFKNNEICFYSHVSKGTYIRSLASDIANRLDTVGHLNSLRRIRVGNYDISNALKIEEVDESKVISINECLIDFPSYIIDDKDLFKVKNGQPLFIDNMSDERIAIYSKNKILLAIYQKENQNKYVCLRGINNSGDN